MSGVRRGPLPALVVVLVLLALNQVLVVVHVAAYHDGDPGYVADLLPDGWFRLPDTSGPVWSWLVSHAPPAWLSSLSVLRVQAVLELPFVLLVYLMAGWWFDPALCRRVVGAPVLWLASAAWTAVLCAVELDLRTPLTGQDVALRVASGLVTPLLLRRLLSGPKATHPVVPGGTRWLLGWWLSVTLLGGLVLVVYDVALLYNPGHLHDLGLPALAALVVLVVLRAAVRSTRGEANAPTAVLVRATGWFWALFLVPALPLRYGITLGPRLLSLTGVVLVGVAALVLALRGSTTRVAVRVVLGLAFGGLAAYSAARLAVRSAPDAHPEVALLAGALAGALVTVLCCADSVAPMTPRKPR